jgi:poly-gamma-glutamate capsule biosynthesis protein CapA/YwtB (metallophosphatase superfamily)
MIRILIGGDIYPNGRVQRHFCAGNATEIFHDLLPAIQVADLSIANLECPLVSRESPITKAGPVLGAPVECINGFPAAGWKILNLANNHSYDHGLAGLCETIDAIHKVGVSPLGAGKSIREAEAPVIRQIQGRRVVIYSMAEREFSIADETIAGSNPLDLISFVRAVREHKQGGIFITLIHGGREFYPYPTPETVRRCRFMVEMGADAVICCHTHCPLPWEIYAECPIVYGLGNLIFEWDDTDTDSWNEGYLVELQIEGGKINLETIPYFQSSGFTGARRMGEAETEQFKSKLVERGRTIGNSAMLNDKWVEFCRQKKTTYLTKLFGYNRIMRKLRRVLLPAIHRREDLLQSLLLVQTETHREMLETLFREERLRQ